MLATRASSDLEYHRRAFLKFDTQNTIPAGRSVTSALLTVTVKMGSEDASRLVGAYQVTTSWAESEITWKQRRINEAWGTGGGDLGSKIDDAAVSNKAGTKVTFDVTALVKEAVAGHLGTSRYTRIALVDLENSTSESYREYYLPSDSNSANRPVLKVTYGSTTAAPAPSPAAPTGGKVLRVLHWNISKNGWGTDGKYSPSRIVSWVAKVNPDIISFNEIEKWNQYSQGADGVALYKGLIESQDRRQVVRVGCAGLRRLGRQGSAQRGLLQVSLQLDLPDGVQRRHAQDGRRGDGVRQRAQHQFHDHPLRSVQRLVPADPGQGSGQLRERLR